MGYTFHEGIVKSLQFDKATNRSKAILLKFGKRGFHPYLRYPAGEEILVLKEVVKMLAAKPLTQGDYLYTPPTGKHSVTTETGCILFLSIPEEVIIRS
ncbi:MAG: cupin domain-containing protein [Flavobacteriaceae bacterium]